MTNNANAEMPRSYYSGSVYGDYYNFYSATAETGAYSMSSSNATYSICPAGWKIAAQGKLNALYNTIRTLDPTNWPAPLRRMPAMIIDAGSVGLSGIVVPGNNSASLWTSTKGAYNATAMQLFLGTNGAGSSGFSSAQMTNGNSIRCVKAE